MNHYRFYIDLSANATVCVVALSLCFAWVAYMGYKRAKLPPSAPR